VAELKPGRKQTYIINFKWIKKGKSDLTLTIHKSLPFKQGHSCWICSGQASDAAW